jgi:predicted component of type VI protein secretion system
MSSKFSFGKIALGVSLGPASARQQQDPEQPFHLVLLGDFTGRSTRNCAEPVAERQLWTIDCDNFEQVCARLQP